MRPHSTAVPRYFFDLTNGSGLLRDDEGLELDDPAQAREAAVRSARDVAGCDIREGRGASLRSFIAIRDAGGAEIARVNFADALGITG